MNASGPQFSSLEKPLNGKALIYLLKPDSAATDGVTTCLALSLNEIEYGCLKGKGYVVAQVDPGAYKAALVNKASFGFKVLKFNLNLKSNETVYLEYAFARIPNGESLDTRFASLGYIISDNHIISKIKESEALKKLIALKLSL